MKSCCYPGSFDPISNGHLDIINRISKQFDIVHIVVANNIKKQYTFSLDERVNMIKKAVENLKNVNVYSSNDLVVNYCKQNNINVIIRGLRNFQDYEAEFSLYQFNRDINPNIETMILMPSTKNQFLSSSTIKELITFNIDISPYVPKEIINDIYIKFKR